MPDEVLARRTAIEAAAAKAELVLPATLKDDFEDDDDFSDALDEATAETAAIAHYSGRRGRRSDRTRPRDPGGPVGSDPGGLHGEAGTAFAAGDLARSVAEADSARSAWTTAPDVGQGRVRECRRAGAGPPGGAGPAGPDHPGSSAASSQPGGVRHHDVATGQPDDGSPDGARRRLAHSGCDRASDRTPMPRSRTLHSPPLRRNRRAARSLTSTMRELDPADGDAPTETLCGDPVRRFRGRLLRSRGGDPRARGSGPRGHHGGLHPPGRRAVRHR